MTREELEKEARQKALEWNGEKINGKYNRPPIANWSCYEKGYLAGAEPREKQIQIDAEQILALQNQNGELTDKVKELEAQVEKMRCCGNCEWKAKGVCNGNDTCGLKEWKLVETRR